MFSRMFASDLPFEASLSSSNSTVWLCIMKALWDTHHEIHHSYFLDDLASHLSKDALASRIQHILDVKVPRLLRNTRSIDLVYEIGNSLAWGLSRIAPNQWEYAIQLFTQLDLIVVEIRNTDGISLAHLGGWHNLRSYFTLSTRVEGFWGRILRMPQLQISPALRLSDDHFDNLRGHGPLFGVRTRIPALRSI